MTATIAAALVAAQADMPVIGKDAVNPHFKNKYATLDTIIETIRPVLAQHGLAIVQSATPNEAGTAITVTTTIIHTSGETVAGSAYIPLAKLDPQGAGAALTYGRRFSLSAVLGLAVDDDDDGNTASGTKGRAAGNAQRMAPAGASREDARKQPPSTPSAQTPKPIAYGGKLLETYATDDLKRIRDKHRADPAMAVLVKGCIDMIARRVTHTTDDDSVARMRAEVEKPDDLPF